MRKPYLAMAATLITIVAGGACGNPSSPEAPAHRPNIIVYMVDTLRARDLGCYGAQVTKTPRIDRFASESTLFERATTPSPATRPAVASLMTGVTPYVHGVESLDDYLSDATSALARLPELLKDQGYSTAAIVANPNVDLVFGFGQGFDRFKGLYAQRGDRTPAMAQDLTYVASRVVAEVKAMLDAMPKDRPFFLFVLSIDPHAPYTPPEPFDRMYEPTTAGGAAGAMRSLLEFDRALQRGQNPDPADILALYRGEVSYTDRHFGDLLDWLDEQSLSDNSLVVFTSDHGEEFVEHGRRGHGKTTYEETTHIPLILRYPEAFPATRRGEAVDLLDLSATLVEMAHGARPEYWQGRDLREPLKARATVSVSRIPDRYDQIAVRWGQYKLIRDRRADTTAVFDLIADPLEQEPLSVESLATHGELLENSLARFSARTLRLHDELVQGSVDVDDNEVPEEIRKRLESLGYVGN